MDHPGSIYCPIECFSLALPGFHSSNIITIQSSPKVPTSPSMQLDCTFLNLTWSLHNGQLLSTQVHSRCCHPAWFGDSTPETLAQRRALTSLLSNRSTLSVLFSSLHIRENCENQVQKLPTLYCVRAAGNNDRITAIIVNIDKVSQFESRFPWVETVYALVTTISQWIASLSLLRIRADLAKTKCAGRKYFM